MEDSTDASLEGNESNSIYLNSSMSEDSSNNTFLAKCDSCDTQNEDSSHSSFLAKCVSHDTQKFTADNSNSSSSTTCYDLVDSEDNWSESTSFRVRVRCQILIICLSHQILQKLNILMMMRVPSLRKLIISMLKVLHQEVTVLPVWSILIFRVLNPQF